MPADLSVRSGPAIAIVGIAGLFPGSDTLEGFWNNICQGVDSTTEVPPGRWLIEPAEAFNSRIGRADCVYSTRGGFVPSERFDPGDLAIEGISVSTLDPVFQLALHVARAAWGDARTERVDARRAGVILGNIVLPVESLAGWSREVLSSAFEEQMGLPAQPPHDIEPANVFPAGLPAAFVARALGLFGPAYTLDAACATSLYSIALAVGELEAGRADAMLCGGVSRPDALYIQMGFSQLRALSARGRPSPFDRSADGLVAGEGAGMFVLKRLEDALEHGDRIYGLVASSGLSNDCRGDLLAPSSEGQLRAMRRAYQKAGWSPHDIDLIECHATGAAVGDAVEVESLKALWGEGGWRVGECAIGSVKSNIGHALTAAGAAGLLKVLLALKHRILPPTANFEIAAPKLGLEESPFRVLSRSEPWPPRRAGEPRRAAVSGFGFGGINAHVLIEEWCGSPEQSAARVARPRSGGLGTHGPKASPPIAIVGMAARFGPIEGLARFRERVLYGNPQSVAAPPRGWWGVPENRWFQAHDARSRRFDGLFIEELEFRVDQFRIPPRELEEMLPQQSLMLEVAARAVKDSRWSDQLALSTGVLIGIGLDLSTTNYHLRWSLAGQARRWNQSLGLGLSSDELQTWIGDLKTAAGPPLSANRTIGSLGGMVASRVARELRIGGPSFTVSCDETSGIQALAIAAHWLDRRELDAAIVGAVDLAGDLRAVLTRQQLAIGSGAPCDGAVALVLKRLDDARRDGDRVYAVLRESDGGWGHFDRPRDGARVGYVDIQSAISITPGDSRDFRGLDPARLRSGTEDSFALGSIEGDLGAAGAAAGLAAVAKAALCLDEQIIPGLQECPDWPGYSGAVPSSVFLPEGPQFWMRNRSEGPRRATVSASNLGGNRQSVILEEFEDDRGATLPDRRLGLFAIEAEDRAGLVEQIGHLAGLARGASSLGIDRLAREWWRASRNDPRRARGIAVIADSAFSLERLLVAALERVNGDHRPDPHRSGEFNRIYLGESIASGPKRMAFVYPGLGNQFLGMGRGLSVLWPEVLRAQDAASEFLRDQLDPRVWWADDAPLTFDGHCVPILGSVALGCLVTDVLRGLGLAPDAAIGYSLGESTALIALRAWTGRDEMLHRLKSSPLFQTVLAGPCNAARRVWQIPANEPVNWVAGVVPCSPERVRAAIGSKARVEILIKNTADETVIGGSRRAVEEVVAALGCPFFELSTVSTVHCSIGRAVEQEYRALHDVATNTPAGIAFYSGVWARTYAVDRTSAAQAIAAQASAMIDFPAVIERAYEDGVRVFVEAGPGSSCSRLISQILGRRAHLACSASRAESDPLLAILEVLGRLIAERLPVDLGGLYGREPSRESSMQQSSRQERSDRATVRVQVRGSRFPVPAVPSRAVAVHQTVDVGALDRAGAFEHKSAGRSAVLRSILDAERATAEAHRTFLKVASDSAALIARHVAFEFELIEESARRGLAHAEPPPLLDRRACLEFAVGSAAVLGPEFAASNGFPTRVRLPDEPLMLVDRVLKIEGVPRSMQGGRIVTEHVVQPGVWYLDAGRVVPSIAIEAGQADLLLCGYLGVDFETQGKAVYRLLDATATFHSALPREGDVIRYDIRIDEFFRQGQTILFRFRLDATVAGEPFLSMRDGCAGFFTADELAAGRGIIPHTLDLSSRAERSSGQAVDLVPAREMALAARELDALRRGDVAGAFGPPFDQHVIDDPLPLAGGLLELLHRVTSLDTAGGSFRLGFIRAETEIHPDDWFLVCHFVDDRVMPGTLMYQSCLDALRILMMGMGLIGRRGQVAYEPVKDASIRLRCRGQVVESTQRVTYEITIKERGYRPEPYAIADALVVVDGKPIVELIGISLQLSGTNRYELETLWGRSAAEPVAPPTPRVPVFFDNDRILAFALGKPVQAFGEAYRPFDNGRFLARLPAPPFQCVNRIIRTDARPWVMEAGKHAVAEFDIDPDAWFFDADRGDSLPLAILLEIALQPCGWLAAYMGSALNSPEDLVFRNLGGTARLHRAVSRRSGTLTTRVKATKITSAAGMILQWYEFAVESSEGPVYDGAAEFGFFPPSAMRDQVGIRDAVVYHMSEEESLRAESTVFPDRAPFPDSRWRMVDQVDEMLEDGGPAGLGVIRGSSHVNKSAWFFAAHFMNDPVWPGSLGLESMLQLLKLMAINRWGGGARSAFESPVLGESHRWTYRGQIVPTDHRVTVQAVIKSRDDKLRRLHADGHLEVDGKIIYQMHDFAIGLSDG
jgi:acyl transferase domain-containing protein/3-hydroxymyristoyl/3-hydroxydecanoyl-(acyl carrier protein) dehydratase